MIRLLTRGAVAAMIAVTLLLPFNTVKAGIPVGTWRAHPAYNDATFSIKAFGCIYVLSDGALYLFDPSDNALYTIDKTGGMGDYDIAAIDYCSSEKVILMAYSNGNMDLLYEDQGIYNFTDIKNNNSGSIKVNELKVIGRNAYISTNIGLIVFDVKRREIKNTYRFETEVLSSVMMSDSLICATQSGIYVGVTSDNLLDNTNWNRLRGSQFKQIFLFSDHLCALSVDNRLWMVNTQNGSLSNIRDNVESVSFLENSEIALIGDSAFSIYSSVTDHVDFNLKREINHVLKDGDNLWISEGVNGLCLYTVTDNDVIVGRLTGIKPNSPRRNLFHSVSWPTQGRLLAVSGCHNYAGIDYPGSVMIYENDTWKYLEEDLKSKKGLDYVNLTEAAQDPLDPSHIFVGSAGQGLYEFKNGRFVNLYTAHNSPLTSILNGSEYETNNYVRISALQYDGEGNLWMANNETDTILRVLKPDGNWVSLPFTEMAGLPTYKNIRFDSKGRLWINSSRGLHPGLFCIDLNGTLDNKSDDRIKFTGSVWKNQDGNTEEIYDLFFYEFDLEGSIWIGTNRGIFVLRNPDSFIDNPNPVFERIKISRNDGSGLADYLFNGVMTTAMYIDQGNRKWIGTLDDGIFLMSADGTETLEHFTTSNSPLPSNNIISITENGQDGSLFFGTNLGMVEYGGQARDPEKTLSESNILVYPNPVKPDFDGYVTITGLTQWSSIRILSGSGRLVHQGISNGGSYSWDLTDINNRQVPSGVYHAIITNQENNTSQSVSITVIR